MTITLREALAHVDQHGFGDSVDHDAIVKEAAAGLLNIYDEHALDVIDGGGSAADECASLYELLCSVGLPVP